MIDDEIGPILVLGPHSVIVFPFFRNAAPPAARSRDVCDRCSSAALIKVKGCVRCEACGYKGDCNGW